MDKQKLCVVIMGENCERTIGMALESVKDADAIVYCDGGSEMEEYFEAICNDYEADMISNEYDQEDKTMNGKQRNFYLNYVKKNYPGWWCLAIDADEVVEDLSRIKEEIQTHDYGLYSVRMRHLIGDLGHEDAREQKHWVLNRLFKIQEAGIYPEVEHPVLKPLEEAHQYFTDCTTIWHLSYIPNMWEIKKKYENHLKKSNMHTPEYLKQWYFSHLFGEYPKKQFDPVELPSVILKEFGIDTDELYFANRGIELKHPLMVRQWYEFFRPTSVLDLGCGRGPFLNFWNWFCPARGIEISKYAVDNSFSPEVKQGDISKEKDMDIWHSDLGEYTNVHYLITAIDVLEHLNDKDLDKTINNMIKFGEKFLISVPVIGDPNLDVDKSHIQRKTREEWVKQFTDKGLKEVEVPEHFLFREQLLIFEK